MVAPSGGGQMVRDEYKKDRGVPALLAVNQNYSSNALDIAKAYSNVIVRDNKSVMKSQLITMDIITKEITINSNEKVKVITK